MVNTATSAVIPAVFCSFIACADTSAATTSTPLVLILNRSSLSSKLSGVVRLIPTFSPSMKCPSVPILPVLSPAEVNREEM